VQTTAATPVLGSVTATALEGPLLQMKEILSDGNAHLLSGPPEPLRGFSCIVG